MAITKETRTTLLWMLFIVIAAIMTALFLFPQYQRLRKEQQELKQQRDYLAEKKNESERLRTEVEALKNSPEVVERTAREKFNMARKGETIMRYAEKEPDKEK